MDGCGWIEMHSVRMIVARLEPDPARLEQPSYFSAKADLSCWSAGEGVTSGLAVTRPELKIPPPLAR